VPHPKPHNQKTEEERAIPQSMVFGAVFTATSEYYPEITIEEKAFNRLLKKIALCLALKRLQIFSKSS
jgi:hypothetical protein